MTSRFERYSMLVLLVLGVALFGCTQNADRPVLPSVTANADGQDRPLLPQVDAPARVECIIVASPSVVFSTYETQWSLAATGVSASRVQVICPDGRAYHADFTDGQAFGACPVPTPAPGQTQQAFTIYATVGTAECRTSVTSKFITGISPGSTQPGQTPTAVVVWPSAVPTATTEANWWTNPPAVTLTPGTTAVGPATCKRCEVSGRSICRPSTDGCQEAVDDRTTGRIYVGPSCRFVASPGDTTPSCRFVAVYPNCERGTNANGVEAVEDSCTTIACKRCVVNGAQVCRPVADNCQEPAQPLLGTGCRYVASPGDTTPSCRSVTVSPTCELGTTAFEVSVVQDACISGTPTATADPTASLIPTPAPTSVPDSGSLAGLTYAQLAGLNQGVQCTVTTSTASAKVSIQGASARIQNNQAILVVKAGAGYGKAAPNANGCAWILFDAATDSPLASFLNAPASAFACQLQAAPSGAFDTTGKVCTLNDLA